MSVLRSELDPPGAAPAAAVQLEEGLGTGRTAATEVGENEFGRRTFPDESVPRLPPKGAPTESQAGCAARRRR
jgi:hypothetical protein